MKEDYLLVKWVSRVGVVEKQWFKNDEVGEKRARELVDFLTSVKDVSILESPFEDTVDDGDDESVVIPVEE